MKNHPFSRCAGCVRSCVNVLRSRRLLLGAVLGLDSQALAALGAASIQHGAATAGSHANTETMGALAADDGRLVSTFHFGLASQQKWVGTSRGPFLFRVMDGKHKTRQAVNPQLNLNFCLSVNYLGKCGNGNLRQSSAHRAGAVWAHTGLSLLFRMLQGDFLSAMRLSKGPLVIIRAATIPTPKLSTFASIFLYQKNDAGCG